MYTLLNMSRSDDVEGILGAIGPFWAKLGLGAGTSPAEPDFFNGNLDDLSATSQRPIFTKFGHET